jgi:Ca2+-binding RTX toxin-like protein
VLYGGRGDDWIWGGAHDDKIYTWHGSNVVTGGGRNDRIWATGSGEGDDDYKILRGHDGMTATTGSLFETQVLLLRADRAMTT